MREENIYFHHFYRIEMFVKYLWWEVVLLLNSREVFHATSRIMMNKYVNVFQSYCVSDDLLITSDTEVMLRQKSMYAEEKEMYINNAECTKR